MRHLRTDAGQLILVHPLDHRCEDGLLVRKQQIERRPRDFAALGDVAHCGASKTISAEYFRRAFDDALMLAAGNRHLLAPFFRKRLSNWRSDIITDCVISSKAQASETEKPREQRDSLENVECVSARLGADP